MSHLTPVEHLTIYKDAGYNTFPSVVKRPDGTMLLGFRQAPDRRPAYPHGHIDPSSKAVTVSSRDGIHWDAAAAVLYDHFLYGVQDPCLNQLRNGTLLATFFMWKVMDPDDAVTRKFRDRNVYGNWLARPAGAHSVRSTDGGKTWDKPVPFPIAGSIRGNGVEMSDGALLVPLYCPTEDGLSRVHILQTGDQGQTWEECSVIESQDGHHFHEPTLHRTPSGKLVVFTRSLHTLVEPGKEREKSPLYTFESKDNGRTWSPPVRRPFYSPSPFHALGLDNGRILLTYGYRLQPYGIRAIMLDAECERWAEAEETVLREDGLGVDIGYTSAVQLDDGRILVTYYYYDEADGNRYIAATLCEFS